MNRLELFLKELFGHEGGFQNHKEDSGNYHKGTLYGTIWGITAKNHFIVFRDCYELYLRGMIKESLLRAERFYKDAHYWNPLYDKIKDSSLAYRLFDFGVNAGVVTSVRLIQKVVKKYYYSGIIVDGMFGKYTLKNVNNYANPFLRLHLTKKELIPGENEFYTLYVKEIGNYYSSLSNFWKFGKGWLNRIKQIFNNVPDLYKQINVKPVEEIK